MVCHIGFGLEFSNNNNPVGVQLLANHSQETNSN
jgi:hypothetical protein